MAGDRASEIGRIAQTSLCAALAAILHMADLLLTQGLVGPLLCALPHALACRLHGPRTAATGSLAAAVAVGLLSGPFEGGYHLFLFGIPGVAAGRVHRTPEGHRVILEGLLATFLGLGAVYFGLERLMGLEDVGSLVPSPFLAGVDFGPSLVRGLIEGHAWLATLPGMASPELRARQLDAMMEFPWGLLLVLASVWFGFCWLASARALSSLGLPVRVPPLPAAPRLPAWIPITYLVLAQAPAEGPHAGTVANACLVLAAAGYAVGYLTLFHWSRGHPARVLPAMAFSLPLWFVTVWTGFLTALPGRPELNPLPSPADGSPKE